MVSPLASAPLPDPVPARPSDAPAPDDAAQARQLTWVLAVAVLVRALAFPFTDNLYGDAVVRTELAQRWLENPHLITSFADGVYQFGPLHTYYLALFLKLWPNPEWASRLSSMFVGVLAVIPLYRTTRREFGPRAALWSGLAFSVWGMHIQSSTTAGSEALGMFLFAWAVDGLSLAMHERTMGPLFWSALALNGACAVRYDVWMYIPLFVAVLLFSGKDRISAGTQAVVYGLLAIVFPAFWMEGNEKAMGDPLYPIHFISDFHAKWTQWGIDHWPGKTKLRQWGSIFWPATAWVTLTPLVGTLAFLGMARAFVKKESQRWLVVLFVVPSLYFAFRAAVLLNFSPLARFAINQVYLCLPFIVPGYAWVLGKRPEGLRRGVTAVTAAFGVLFTGGMAVWSYKAEPGGYSWQGIDGVTLKGISPVSTMPQNQMDAAHWLRDHVGPGELLVMDFDGSYTDVGVGFYSHIPEAQLVRSRWEDFPKRFPGMKEKWVIAFKEGELRKRLDTQFVGDTVTILGKSFVRVASLSDGLFEVFQAKP
jgi:4-amino-4-deoxy-L-arabinose transferase-like glycosyltransferase